MSTFQLPEAVVTAIMGEVKTAIVSMEDICARVETQRGTQAERIKATTLELRAAECEAPDTLPFITMRVAMPIDAGGWFGYADQLATAIDAYTAELAEVRETCKGLVNAALKAKHNDTTTELAGLVEEYNSLKDKIVSAENLLGVKVEYPSLPKTRGSASPSTRVSSKMGRHYVIEDGARRFYFNESFSYLAFKFGVSSDELRKAIAEQGVDNPTDAWECTVTVTGTLDTNAKFGKTQTLTIGHEVTAA